MEYEGECIKNMELAKSYKNHIKLKKTSCLTLLLPKLSIESMKQLMIVKKYEGECIKNMECV